ncbi:antibiotic biosynthesis monooxygenase [Paenibacillus albidus]|nr:antibiotic biosynthesis monooxygenase [Paenibacillus albidus]
MDYFAMYGKLTAHPGQRDALAGILLEAADLLKSNNDCYLYIVNVSDDDPNVVYVTELWKDAEAHTANLKNEEVLASIQRGRPLIAGAEPIKLRALGGKGL